MTGGGGIKTSCGMQYMYCQYGYVPVAATGNPCYCMVMSFDSIQALALALALALLAWWVGWLVKLATDQTYIPYPYISMPIK